MKGLEPSRLSALEPKSRASANSATSADATFSRHKKMAGAAGFEPANAGVKVPCLTAWRRPTKTNKKMG